jgi:hypothetical protein
MVIRLGADAAGVFCKGEFLTPAYAVRRFSLEKKNQKTLLLAHAQRSRAGCCADHPTAPKPSGMHHLVF